MTDRDEATEPPAAEHAAWALIGKELVFPEGLLGFPNDRRYRLSRFDTGDGSASPFLILESLDHDLSFPLIHPDFIALEYRLSVSPETMASVNARNEADLVVFLIVTVRDRVEDITVNLQGPLLVNAAALTGKQVVIEEYPLRHSLLQANLR